jgi:hypothetical protein
MLALIAALAVAAPAQPQGTPSGSSSNEIVVEGRAAKQAAAEYVDKLLPAAIGSEIGRFEDRICPKVIGLTEPYKTQVTDRIRQVAKATNIAVAAEACTPNLVVIIAAAKRAMIDTLRKSRPAYFDGVAGDQLKRLADSARPFAAWQVTDEVAADGMPIGKGSGLPTGSNGAREIGPAVRNPDTFVEGDFARLRTTESPSRLRTTTKARVLSSVVIVESGAVSGATIDQLADFAFVKAMLPTEMREHEAPASSILSLFNPGVTPERGPQSVTWWDVAFLKSLTSTGSDKNADIQKAEIRDQMVRQINKAPAGQ